MPHHWQRLPMDVTCGSCGTRVAKTTPLLVITIDGLSRQLVRCRGCSWVPFDETAIGEDIAPHAKSFRIPPLTCAPVRAMAEAVAQKLARRDFKVLAGGKDPE